MGEKHTTTTAMISNEITGVNAGGPPASLSFAVSQLMTPPLRVEARMLEHINGEDSPRRTLLNTGAFSERWVETYFELLEEAKIRWRDEPLWPRDLVAAVHIASLYFPIDYQAWRQLEGSRNKQTEQALSSIRTRSENFLLTPIVRL